LLLLGKDLVCETNTPYNKGRTTEFKFQVFLIYYEYTKMWFEGNTFLATAAFLMDFRDWRIVVRFT
jgi:hypothetical protein